MGGRHVLRQCIARFLQGKRLLFCRETLQALRQLYVPRKGMLR